VIESIDSLSSKILLAKWIHHHKKIQQEDVNT